MNRNEVVSMVPKSVTFSILIVLSCLAGVMTEAVHAQAAAPRDTQAESVKLTTPQQALKMLVLQEGFHASLFAAEPQIHQPIGIATDSRGRLWVAENNTYAQAAVNFDLSQRDRILILEDSDHDGVADRTTVFWDQAQKLTSVEPGFGGVWALCPPQLLFIPDANGDDVPDGEPVVVLDGWDDGPVRHNIANGLRWGPDGWLYGRHGILATSLVGAPGVPRSARVPINCGIWRYHPTRKTFEVVCHGTTNSWGMDWDRHGELFFINTVIGHLWHALPGAHFQRMYGEDFNPHLYALIGQTADHYHWDTSEPWNKTRTHEYSPTTGQAGGGHAHTGLLIYQGENWPQRYRDTMFTINMHGLRLNNDIIERRGAGYVGRHGPDFLETTDPWFRAVDLIAAPDGGVFIADWSDIGECHENDGVHRSSGRIFKIVYGQPDRPQTADIAKASDTELVDLQFRKNEWLVRQARHVLQERASANRPMEKVHVALRLAYEKDPDPLHKLRAMWCLHVTGGTSEEWLLRQLSQEDEHLRVWAVRLLGDEKAPTPEAIRVFCGMASRDPSGLVLSYLASALQQLPPRDRWGLAEALAGRAEFADDPVLPLMIWYGLEPSVPESPERSARLAGSCGVPTVARMIARRLTENLALVPEPVDRLVELAAAARHADSRKAILGGMADALRGVRKAKEPKSWKSAQRTWESKPDPEADPLARELSVVFGDGRAVRDVLQVASSGSAEVAARREALRVLVDARAPEAIPLLRGLITDRNLGADAAQGLAAFDDPAMPAFLVASYPRSTDDARDAIVITLSSRPAWCRSLLEAIASGKIEKSRVPAFQVRQMSTSVDEDVRRRVSTLWPELRGISAGKRERIEKLKLTLSALSASPHDLSNGRKRFMQACSSCHTLFGQGGKIGPDLTGGQRTNLDYLLENVVDPAASVSADYRMSIVALTDGRVLNGVVGSRNGPTISVQTPTERIVLNRDDIEEIRASNLSLMPEGLLDVLSEKDMRDLTAYLMSPQQVPLVE